MADTIYASGSKKGFKRCGIKSFTEAKVTPVILVCIYNQNSTLITHDLLYNAFINYGRILRILIFEKLKVWKAFVEYDNLDSAFEAKRDLNDYLLFNDGTRMNVYYSNLDTIKFQNSNAGGKDYTIESFGEDGEEEQDPESEAYGMGQSQEAASLYAGSNLSHGRMNFYEAAGAMSPQAYAYPQMAPLQAVNKNSDSDFDEEDDEDEILKIINERQQAPFSKKNSKEPQSINEEEKLEGADEHDKDLFSQFFNTNNTFQPTVPGNTRSSNRARTQISLSLKSQAFSIKPSSPQGSTWQQQQQQQQQPNHGQVPPGLAVPSTGMFSKQKSFTQIPTPSLPLSASKLSSIAENQPRSGFARRNVSHFHSMTTIPSSNYVPTFHQILNNPPAEDLGKIRQYPGAIGKTDSRGSFEHQRNSSQGETDSNGSGNGMSYDDLVERIEHDIRNSSAGSGHEDGRVGGLLQETLGNKDVSNLSNMSLSALSHLYNELSVLLGKADPIRKSNILLLKGLDDNDVQVNMIYNIFSNFGNIAKIYLMRNKASALVEFENTEHASQAKEYLDNIIFLGSPLQIQYSSGPIPSEVQNEAEDIFIGSTKTYRFKKTKTISINPPSPTLHISNLPREVCNDESVRDYFSSYGLIEGIRFKFVDNKNMCLLKLSCVEESVMAMAMLHDTELGGRKIQISFTRSKF